MENIISTTTINVPYFLEPLCKNILKYKKNYKTAILVIGDLKTPKNVSSYCNKVSKKFNIKIIYFDVIKQKKEFSKKKDILKFFPYNDAVRRILGSLYVYNLKPKRLIFIDDDNFIDNTKDFIKYHSIVGKKISAKGIYAKNKWPNIYKYLKSDVDLPLFPRGFPWKYRNQKSFDFKKKFFSNKKVIANCGYILGDPDIDAVSRLFWKIDVKKISSKNNHNFIYPNMFCPFNDQNTCISGDILTLYYKPVSAGRNSDIWTSYFINKVSAIHSNIMSYGQPYATQIRNIHDNWKDYEFEKMHNMSTDIFVDILENIKIKKNENYYKTFDYICCEAINIISKRLRKIVIKNKTNARHYQSINQNELIIRERKSLKFINEYFHEYKKWLNLIKKYDYI